MVLFFVNVLLLIVIKHHPLSNCFQNYTPQPKYIYIYITQEWIIYYLKVMGKVKEALCDTSPNYLLPCLCLFLTIFFFFFFLSFISFSGEKNSFVKSLKVKMK